MTNNQGNSVGIASMLVLALILICLVMFSSCGTLHKLTDEQVSHRNEIQYEINKVWNEYSYKTDSLWIEYYKKQTMEILILIVVFYIYEDAKLKGNTYDQKRLMNPSAISYFDRDIGCDTVFY